MKRIISGIVVLFIAVAISLPAAELDPRLAKAMEYFESVDLGALAQEKPFKAASLLAAASCFERAKRELHRGEAGRAGRALDELAARIEVLKDGKVSKEREGDYSLLNLTTGEESQVVVEYDSEHEYVNVGLYYGAVPLMMAEITEHASAETAASEMAKGYDSPLYLVEKTKLAGYQASVASSAFRGRAYPEDYEPSRHYLLVSKKGEEALVISADDEPMVKAEVALILPGCPKQVKDKVKGYAEKTVTPGDGELEAELYIVAGPMDEKAWKEHVTRSFSGWVPVATKDYSVLVGAQIMRIDSAPREAAELFLSLLVEPRAVSLEEVERIKAVVIAAAKPAGDKEAGLAADEKLYCGETHSHTFYSDGSMSPQGLALKAIACFQDFHVITDHNTIDGALVGSAAMADYGFAFPVIVGDELSTTDAHFNAYPLKQAIDPGQSPAELAKEAHAQGAVIHWNHPRWPETKWNVAQYPKLLEGTELDGWEHLHWKYWQWKEQGILPQLVGSSDTHTHAFGWGERTGIFASAAGGEELAAAIKSGRAVLVHPRREVDGIFFGEDPQVALAWRLLAEGKALKQQKAEALAGYLRGADLPGLLAESQPYNILAGMASAEPIEELGEDGAVTLKLKLKNPWKGKELKGTLILEKGKSSWQEASVDVVVPAGGEKEVELATAVKGEFFPVPAVRFIDKSEGRRLVDNYIHPGAGKGLKFPRRLLDDFEDGNLVNQAALHSLAEKNGMWHAVCDDLGVTKIDSAEVEEIKGGRDGSKMAWHVKGNYGVSKDPDWVWISLQCVISGWNEAVDLTPSIGVSFYARSDEENTYSFTCEGTVAGVRLPGTGRGHRKIIKLGKEWQQYTAYWSEMEQPSYACPGEHCVGALTVEKIEHINWAPQDEGKPFDLWLDDVNLIYEK